MVYLLYYVDTAGGWKTKWEWVVNWAGYYDIHPIAIDLAGGFPRLNSPPFCFRSIQEAYNDPTFSAHTWVWLSADAETYVDEFRHPIDNVIYCIGDDGDCFQNFNAEGPRVKIRPTNKEMADNVIWFAAMVAPQVLYDRFMYLNGKRT